MIGSCGDGDVAAVWGLTNGFSPTTARRSSRTRSTPDDVLAAARRLGWSWAQDTTSATECVAASHRASPRRRLRKGDRNRRSRARLGGVAFALQLLGRVEGTSLAALGDRRSGSRRKQAEEPIIERLANEAL